MKKSTHLLLIPIFGLLLLSNKGCPPGSGDSRQIKKPLSAVTWVANNGDLNVAYSTSHPPTWGNKKKIGSCDSSFGPVLAWSDFQAITGLNYWVVIWSDKDRLWMNRSYIEQSGQFNYDWMGKVEIQGPIINYPIKTETRPALTFGVKDNKWLLIIKEGGVYKAIKDGNLEGIHSFTPIVFTGGTPTIGRISLTYNSSDEKYYLAFETDNNGVGAVGVSSSTDGINWTSPSIIIQNSTSGGTRLEYFSPVIEYKNNKIFVATIQTKAIGNITGQHISLHSSDNGTNWQSKGVTTNGVGPNADEIGFSVGEFPTNNCAAYLISPLRALETETFSSTNSVCVQPPNYNTGSLKIGSSQQLITAATSPYVKSWK